MITINLGTNSSALTMDYYIFAVYEKNFNLDIISGHLERIDEKRFSKSVTKTGLGLHSKNTLSQKNNNNKN
jgi:hydrogenase maturation factor